MSSPDLKNFFHGFNVKNIQESLTQLQFDNCYVINAIAFEILWELDQLGKYWMTAGYVTFVPQFHLLQVVSNFKNLSVHLKKLRQKATKYGDLYF